MAIRPEDLPKDPAALVEMVLAFDGENDDLRAIRVLTLIAARQAGFAGLGFAGYRTSRSAWAGV